MKSITISAPSKVDVDSLGRMLTSWTYVPPRSKKFIGYALGVAGLIVIAALAYGRHFLPYLEKLSGAAQAIALLLLSPLFAYLMKLQKDMSYSLYENGFVIRTVDKKAAKDAGKMYKWTSFKTCSYSEHGVKLSPKSVITRMIFLRCASNRMEVHVLCRERIARFAVLTSPYSESK